MDQRELYKTIRSHLLRRATFMTGVKGEAMAPTFNKGADGRVGETLLIRSLYEPSIRRVPFLSTCFIVLPSLDQTAPSQTRSVANNNERAMGLLLRESLSDIRKGKSW